MKNERPQVVLRLRDKESSYSVVFEDNGRVAYAYLIEGDKIITDVWLYNHGKAPSEPEWLDFSRAPFKNSAEFTGRTSFRPVTDPKEVAIVWKRKYQQDLDAAEVYIRGKLHGVMKPGIKPGWSLLAVKDGPVAKVLHARTTS